MTDDPGILVGTARSAVTSGTATIEIGTVRVTAAVLRGVTLADRDPVLVARSGSAWWVLGALGAATPGAVGETGDTVVNPRPAVTSGRLTVAPAETRSWDGTTWRTDSDDVRQGEYGGWGNHTGVAFYGAAPRSLAGATVTAAYVYIRRSAGGDYAARQPTLRLVTQATRPAGAVTLGSSTAGPSLAVNTETLFTLPAAWGQALVDGTAGGIGCYTATTTPYIRTCGTSQWGPAWVLLLDWRR